MSPHFHLSNELYLEKTCPPLSLLWLLQSCQPLARGLANIIPGVREPRVFIQEMARGRPTSLLHLRIAIGIDIELSKKTTGLTKRILLHESSNFPSTER